jgi:hypothetical protein
MRGRQKEIDEDSKQNPHDCQPDAHPGQFRRRRNLRRGLLDRPDKSIASTGEGLDVKGIHRPVAQGVAKLADCPVQALLEVAGGRAGPDQILKLLPADEFPSPGQKRRENPKGLIGQPNPDPVLPEFSRLEI